ncbi:cytochrome c oxidase assembly protein [uncultured Jannaschia sp.]|uniref:cytochrome c oxidase assembly protein n=1 Tax=uncultured Jannaschia sp. TaxID=293347 RepID=UPI00260606FD|nr:cytochrome c oxidase assembly protein [uncultured Jannaschia sp.]
MDRIYCGVAPLPAELWSRWNLDPVLLGALALLAALVWRTISGRLAVAVLFLAFVSPLCALSSALFSARVVHHVLLVAVAAPLLVRAAGPRGAGLPASAFAVSTATLWAWHWPGAYDLALSHVGVYWLMQLSLLGSAVWFWRVVLAPERSGVEALTLIVAAFAQMGMLGAILFFAPQPLYEAHLLAPFAWGLAPLDDQRLGGLLMWVPAGLPYAAVAAFVARRGWTALRRAPA